MLVTAYFKLGLAYLEAKCYEQALEHLTTSFKLNGTLIQEISESKEYHTKILTTLGRCYMLAGNFKDAQNLLEKSLATN